ncbi:hypothetical protein BRADI_4g00896v3 [Brachypodium distachyon]|uniref:Uncharacterized protein n=1 Tax=Brachypodium distachyon TaxID=15368 RepID=A0A2K2CJS1_BRADI|nr:hypothetical protein BRADI_4g00896v3 [Brachypodium distachyon]
MASKGIIDKEKFDSFYIPVYGPREQEVREIILEDGSFFIKEMHMKGSASVEDGQMRRYGSASGSCGAKTSP